MIIDFYNRNGGGGSVPIATRDTAGIVKVGSGLTVDSAGTLSQEVISIDLANKSQSELAAIQQFVSGHTNDYRFQFTWLIPGDNPTWATSVDYGVDGNDGSIYLTFLNREGVSWWGYLQPSGTMQYLGGGQYVTKPDSTDYSLFNKNLHLSSGGTLYFDDTEVDSGGTYDGILNIWGRLILVGAYQFINTHTGPFDTMLCPLYVDSSSTDSGRILMCPKVIDEPANVSIPGKEIANHKVTLVYDEYKISWYQRGSQDWITGLTVTQNPITKFWKGTQAQYDALAPNYDNNTLYVIV